MATIVKHLRNAAFAAAAISSAGLVKAEPFDVANAKNLGQDVLEILAGQHIIYSYPGLTPPDELYDYIKQGKVLGVILFGENVGNSTPAVLESLQEAYRQYPLNDGLPLLITTDQEGGEIRRLPGGPYLSEKEMGASADPVAAATTSGNQAAQALLDYGVNINLAPVLGVYREEGDFLDYYGRSFSMNASVVRECGQAIITAQQAQIVASTAKHFPGLGDANQTQDTDVEPVTIPLSLETLETVDLVPYPAAIAAGVRLVMASWATYPALDATYPSGLSKKWIQGQLRERLGFRGVTITDALEAGALNPFGDTANRTLLATQAGMDILLASSRNFTQGQQATQALAAGLRDGSVNLFEFAESTERIRELRKWLAKQ